MFTALTNRWKKQWTEQDITPRLRELTGEFLSRLLITLVITGAAGATIIYLLPDLVALTTAGIEFLALIYILMLGIATSHSFDNNRVNFILKQIQLDLVHIGDLAGYSHLDDLKKSIDELIVRRVQS
jgi:hypothetical protein